MDIFYITRMLHRFQKGPGSTKNLIFFPTCIVWCRCKIKLFEKVLPFAVKGCTPFTLECRKQSA
jgi:hypothetical protein